ncbi:hypothetical protein K466DRAFT_56065 [Polyporus arcularius HHB13444]|uniref:Uncharacterized protein n=1 Tax=Polyporus arcularius HHB13444 TaxID=1314778 RepID=A0A5C3PGE1_9APHY|nr:hypothetical protein K466DRAFT_56065 [Polyporus arcularius HHB13444]
MPQRPVTRRRRNSLAVLSAKGSSCSSAAGIGATRRGCYSSTGHLVAPDLPSIHITKSAPSDIAVGLSCDTHKLRRKNSTTSSLQTRPSHQRRVSVIPILGCRASSISSCPVPLSLVPRAVCREGTSWTNQDRSNLLSQWCLERRGAPSYVYVRTALRRRIVDGVVPWHASIS